MTLLDSAINQYKCCCGCMSVVTGTKIICGLTLFECFISLVAWVINGGPFSGDGTVITRIVISAYLAYLPFEGIKKKKSLYFIPFLVYLVILMICASMVSYGFAEALHPESSEIGYEVRKWIKDLFKDYPLTKEDLDNIILFFGCASFVGAAVVSWFFSVIYKCFKYVRQIHTTGYDKMANPMNV